MYLLLDLDGTLTNTADIAFKDMKDGKLTTDVNKIPIINGAIKFLTQVKQLGWKCFIISDSHPKYVNPIFSKYFNEYCESALSLSDKPNTVKTLEFCQSRNVSLDNKTYMIGDSWLDIELGRGLNIPTILTQLYKAQNIEIRDGIGEDVKNLKSGSTYHARTFDEIISIIQNPQQSLLCLEAKFKYDLNSTRPIKLITQGIDGYVTLYRALARQHQGEGDEYLVTEKYFEFSQAKRSDLLLSQISSAVANYIKFVQDNDYLRRKGYSSTWHTFTYMPDKSSTIPPDKMRKLFQLVSEAISDIQCYPLLTWRDDVQGSTRTQATSLERENFVNNNIIVDSNINLQSQNIIILDDQYTTGSTANVITQKLRDRGAKNILFLNLFHLVNLVQSNKFCPRCQTRMEIKINRKTGDKFYSCTPPKFKGNGCGYTENIPIFSGILPSLPL